MRRAIHLGASEHIHNQGHKIYLWIGCTCCSHVLCRCADFVACCLCSICALAASLFRSAKVWYRISASSQDRHLDLQVTLWRSVITLSTSKISLVFHEHYQAEWLVHTLVCITLSELPSSVAQHLGDSRLSFGQSV